MTLCDHFDDATSHSSSAGSMTGTGSNPVPGFPAAITSESIHISFRAILLRSVSWMSQPKNWTLMSNAKQRFLAGTILSAILIWPVYASTFGAGFVLAQAPAQTEEEKKPPQRPGQPPRPQPQQ